MTASLGRTLVNMSYFPPKPQQNQPFAIFRANEACISIWHERVLFEKEDVDLNFSDHTMFIFQSLKTKRDITIRARNVFILADVTSSKGRIKIETTEKCVVFGRRLASLQQPDISGCSSFQLLQDRKADSVADLSKKSLAEFLSQENLDETSILNCLMYPVAHTATHTRTGQAPPSNEEELTYVFRTLGISLQRNPQRSSTCST